ncbi:iron-containing alcohol dehydrogenase [Lachnospiraceae bacterium KGMB03038]|nr:iron-containing alcohol dehydrogenase [Lachnospiraceae bacterium KGMB03038]
MQKTYEIEMPQRTYLGPGCLDKIADDIRRWRGRSCLIVTDAFLAASNAGTRVKEVIEKSGAQAVVYDGVCPNPTLETVTKGVELLLQARADLILSLGGGSAHDCAKAMRLVAARQGGKEGGPYFLIAVNTTAGTGSEVTKFAIITDEAKHRKLSLIDSLVVPDVAVNDPLLMMDMPKRLTAQTGMDALTHALESYVSAGANPFTRANAKEAVRLIAAWLPKAYEDGKNLEARDAMAYAEYLAGLAFSNSGLGMVHAMAHQLGGLYNLPHGLCNAVLLPHVITYNLSVCGEEYAQIMELIAPGEFGGTAVRSRRLVQYLRRLNQKLGIPEVLEVSGKNEDLEILIRMAQEDPSMKCNPRQPGMKELKEIYINILKWRS